MATTDAARGNPHLQLLCCPVQISSLLCRFNDHTHVLALGIILALSLYRPFLLWLVPAVLCSHLWWRRGLKLRHGHSVRLLCWHPDGTWAWQLHNGRDYKGTLVHASMPCRFFVLLHLRRRDRDWRATVVPLACDSLPADIHRRLRVRLTLWAPGRKSSRTIALLQRCVHGIRDALFPP